jgi:acyl-CoA synthetase (AMP-forming)/AMP-acid ligase II
LYPNLQVRKPLMTLASLDTTIARARSQSLSGMLRRVAERHGDRTAIICGDVAWTYAEFVAEVDRLASGLSALGIGAGDRVAILARNSHAFIALRFAIARADAVLVPINFMLNADDVRFILDHSGARVLFADATTIEVAHAARGESVEHLFGIDGENVAPPAGVPSWQSLRSDASLPQEERGGEDLLQIVYTSGTESRPKGAMLSHNAVLWEYQSCIIDCEWTTDTIALHAMPLFHCAQLDCHIGPALHVGARNIITGTPSPVEPASHHLVLRPADGVDFSAARARDGLVGPLRARKGLLRGLDHAGRGAARTARAPAAPAPVEPLWPDRDRAGRHSAVPRRTRYPPRLGGAPDAPRRNPHRR